MTQADYLWLAVAFGLVVAGGVLFDLAERWLIYVEATRRAQRAERDGKPEP